MDDKETAFQVSKKLPGQAEARTAYQIFLADEGKKCPWWDEYQRLRAEGFTFREAMVMAWASQPGPEKWPGKTQADIAKVLGCSARTVHSILNKPAVREYLERPAIDVLWAYRNQALHTLGEMATLRDYKANQDRKLFFQMVGDIGADNEMTLRHKLAQPDLDLSKLTDEELEQLEIITAKARSDQD